MSEKKHLKSYLKNAEYLLVLMKPSKTKPNPLRSSSLHIPNKRFTEEMLKVCRDLNFEATCTAGKDKDKVSRIKQIFSSPSQIKISHVKEEEFEKNHTLRIAKMASVVCLRQDLHHLHFGMIYYAGRKNSSFKGWKIPKLIEAPKYLMRSSIKPISKQASINLLSKISKLSTSDKEQGTGNKEFEDGRRAYEKERLRYRNYRSANTLHT